MNHRTLIALWPDIEIFAIEMAVPTFTAAGWRNRNSIPARYWTDLVCAARNRGFVGVTFENLARGVARKAAA